MRLVLLSLFVVVSFLSAQSQEDTVVYNKISPNCPYFKSYINDVWEVGAAPFKPTKRRAISYGIAAAGTAVLFCYDEDINDFAKANVTEQSKWASDHIFEPLGSGVYTTAIIGTAFLGGLAFKNKRLTRTAMLSAKSFIIASAFVRIPKYVFRRKRPSVTDNSMSWFNPTNDNSFASGHTTAIFSVASMFAIEYRKTIWVPVLSYTVAGLSGLSRIHDNKHWASDVFCGALLGYGVARLIYYTNSWKVNMTPIVSSDFQAIQLCYKL